jgi:DNA-binding MarR family transcriptional regulator
MYLPPVIVASVATDEHAPAVSHSPAEFGLKLKRAQHLLGGQVDQCLRPMDLNLGLWRVLRALGQMPGASASELARASLHSPQTLGALLERLKQRELVERSTPRGRIVENHLTELGREVLAQANTAVDDVVAEALSGLTALDRAALDELITRLLHVLSTPRRTGRRTASESAGSNPPAWRSTADA